MREAFKTKMSAERMTHRTTRRELYERRHERYAGPVAVVVTVASSKRERPIRTPLAPGLVGARA
jgi:hypothetical protein